MNKKITMSKELQERIKATKLRQEREFKCMDILQDNHILDDLIYHEILEYVLDSMIEYKYKNK